ncbi:MAG TPA: monofunctional biosynthetic peptidoglycan transglycosylase, partial [Paracoccus sp.]|nr:monofunctional biosynthetic peptidoglycan transglycosylase [Paracoccus sp. (in: a-proteobacteria)]
NALTLADFAAAALASVLPGPKTRSAQTGSRRARAIADGAATIRRDGRAACFERD